jgi:hypothetical protein
MGTLNLDVSPAALVSVDASVVAAAERVRAIVDARAGD